MTFDNLGQVISGKKYWAGGTPIAGQQFTNGFDNIGNRQITASGGDGSGNSLRTATYYINNLNEYTSRTVPGYATVLGSANSNATVTVNLQRAIRQGNYFDGELPVANTSAALWLTLTNLAVLNNGTNADIVTTNSGSMLIPQTPETFGYDLDGNMTNSGRWTVSWDGENRATNFTSLSTAPTASKLKVDCVYDWQGRRIQKIVSTNNGTSYIPVSTNRFIYDGWNLIGILDGGNNLQYSFQWGTDLSGSLQGAGGVGGLISMTAYSGTNAGTYFYAYDGNGNVVGVVNSSTANLAGRWEYDEMGNLLRSSGTMVLVNPFRFSSKYWDVETGLNYFGYRYYDSNVGRWLNHDPIGEMGGINLYQFVGNNPANEIDPFGLDNNFEPPTVYLNGALYSGSWNNNIPDITTTISTTGGPMTQKSNNGGFFSNPFIFNTYMAMAGGGEGLGLAGSGLVKVLPRLKALTCFGRAADEGGLRMIGDGARNTAQLTSEQIAQIYQHVDELGLSSSDVIVYSGPSAYSDMLDKILIGPDVFPGVIDDTALSQLSARAVIAHEAGHMISTVGGFSLEGGTVADEIQATLIGSQLPGLSQKESSLLLQHAGELGK